MTPAFKRFNDEVLFQAVTAVAETLNPTVARIDTALRNSYASNEYTDTEKYREETLSRDMAAVYDLFTFYVVLSQYKESKETLQQCNCFLYGWWRKFLYDVAYEIEQQAR